MLNDKNCIGLFIGNVVIISGFLEEQRVLARNRKQSLEMGFNTKRPEAVPDPVFNPKNPELEILGDYTGTFSESYWESWTKTPLVLTPASWINSQELVKVAQECGYAEMRHVRRLASMLVEGVSIGSKGAARLPAQGQNLKSAYELGHLVMDSLASWTKNGTVFGPLDAKEMPMELRISPISCERKPSGAGRVIVGE